jgi:hypothetical protein
MSNSSIAGQLQGVSHKHHWAEILPLPATLTGAMLSPSKDAQLESDTCSPEKDGDEILVSGGYDNSGRYAKPFEVKRAKFR